MTRAGHQHLTAVLADEVPRLRACAAALTGGLQDADALLARVLERVAAAWPRYARSPDPAAAVREELVRRVVRAGHRAVDPQPARAPSDDPLLAALAALPLQHRALLVLRDLSGAPVERAAAVLRVPVGVAEAEHRAAVAALARALGEELAVPAPRDAAPAAAPAPAQDQVVVDLTAPDGAA